MKSNLCGVFQLDKSNLVSEPLKLHLVISQRRKPTPQKPPFYLLQRLSQKEHVYISSLYKVPVFSPNEPTGALETYSFDWKGSKYLLSLNYTSSTAAISNFSPMSVKGGASANGL